MTRKVMKLLDAKSGLMQCKVCGAKHYANLQTNGVYGLDSWHCRCGCKLDDS